MKKSMLIAATMAALSMAPAVTLAADAPVDPAIKSFEGRVIVMQSCNAKQNVILSLYNEETDEMKTFITDAKANGKLNPILARAYISIGKKTKDGSKPSVGITYDPNYRGEDCYQDVAGYWTGYSK